MSQQLHRLALAFVAAFFLIALASGYWGYVRRDALTGRPDNPRRVLAERRTRRGTIYDRNGVVVAESIGAPGNFVRHYPYPDLAPVLGYVSAFYGSAGVEVAADAVLHGDAGQDPLNLWWMNALGAPPPGRDVRLSIDLRLQTIADTALRAAGRTGAVVLVDATTGEILALASHPTYNPNTLDDQWPTLVADTRAPLLNRATFALYQPGEALQPIILAAALRSKLADMEAPLPSATKTVKVDNLALGCRLDPGPKRITLAEAFSYGCPKPFADLGEQLGAHMLDQLFSDFRLYEAPSISIPTTASSPLDLSSEVPLAAIGQGSLTITPLHLALAIAAIARQGELPAPQLIIAAQNPEGVWEGTAPLAHPIAAIAPEYADQVKALMTEGHQAVALAGTEGKTLAWFSGFAPFTDSRYAVTVLLEDGEAEKAAKIGRELLGSATR